MPVESELEARFVDLIRSAGLPEPIRQMNVGDESDWIGRVDFAYPAVNLLVELDGRRHHSAKLDLEADRRARRPAVAGGLADSEDPLERGRRAPGPGRRPDRPSPRRRCRAARRRPGGLTPGHLVTRTAQGAVLRHRFGILCPYQPIVPGSPLYGPTTRVVTQPP